MVSPDLQTRVDWTYFDAVQIRLASSLEVGMGELPDVLLDLTSIVVNVFYLLRSESLRFGPKVAYLGEAVFIELSNKTGEIGMSERLRPVTSAIFTHRDSESLQNLGREFVHIPHHEARSAPAPAYTSPLCALWPRLTCRFPSSIHRAFLF